MAPRPTWSSSTAGGKRLRDLAEKARSGYDDNWAGVLAMYVAAAERA